ncbi:MAG: DUF2752 domain-containing protein [Lachnospiraceae bacterium]|nr:DUF2752 domain-containing protein [Lachnospiraceae bacterium]
MENFDRKTEDACYIALNVGIVILAAAAALIRSYQVDLHEAFPLCFFYRMTGYYCPGCGGTRAMVALLHLHILQSFRCHPIVVYTAAVLGCFWICKTAELLSGRRFRGMRLKPVYLYIALGLVMLQWIVKNVLLMQGIGIETVF